MTLQKTLYHKNPICNFFYPVLPCAFFRTFIVHQNVAKENSEGRSVKNEYLKPLFFILATVLAMNEAISRNQNFLISPWRM